MMISIYSITKYTYPQRVFRIWYSPLVGALEKACYNGGWAFSVANLEHSPESSECIEVPVYDGWDDSFDIIIQYPEQFTSENLVWFDKDSNLLVSLSEMSDRLKSPVCKRDIE